MQTILAFGNYMNGGTNRGAAFGFKLESILRLSEIRSDLDPKMTGLHYVIEMISENFPNALGVAHVRIFWEGGQGFFKKSFSEIFNRQEFFDFPFLDLFSSREIFHFLNF
jgi:hypothetical protein